MKALLLRLFGLQTQDGTATAVLAAPAQTTAAAPEPATSSPDLSMQWQLPARQLAQFTQWMLGPHLGAPSPYTERAVLAALDRVLHSELSGSQLIPRVPSVLPQLLKSLRNEKVTAGDLAQQIAKDVVLVAELMAEVNNSCFQGTQKINSLDKAVQLLGLNGLRMLIARNAFRPLIQAQTGHLTNALAPLIWEYTEKTAQACRILALQRGLDEFTAFLAGLLRHVGLIIALRTIDQTGVTRQLPASARFQQSLTEQALLLSVHVGRQWQFPDTVLEAVLHADANEDHAPDVNTLSHCISQAQQLTQLYLLQRAEIVTPAEIEKMFAEMPQLLECCTGLSARMDIA
ncbi:HDOD domain-containing protein [Undibacterium crateris]|uniref:HDOD domain-containing protein n=1 Tax=Undibacterium crateris TaxID=2528175 RepID=UPI00138A2447|nr:HDOD domain-containing protein [Undibacterium crateris]NDI85284.1 HDOD domain-containing protein [Undibacterium crateris]